MTICPIASPKHIYSIERLLQCASKIEVPELLGNLGSGRLLADGGEKPRGGTRDRIGRSRHPSNCDVFDQVIYNQRIPIYSYIKKQDLSRGSRKSNSILAKVINSEISAEEDVPCGILSPAALPFTQNNSPMIHSDPQGRLISIPIKADIQVP